MFGKKQKPIDEWSFEDEKHNELIKVRRNILSIETKELKAQKKELAVQYKEANAELKPARKQLKSGEMSQEDFDAVVAKVKAVEKERKRLEDEVSKANSKAGGMFQQSREIEDLRGMIQVADNYMYEVKTKGKNGALGKKYNSDI